ncbi:MAG: hypothetical protein ACOYM3_01110 [Terrimicrobiaceae bacterium]
MALDHIILSNTALISDGTQFKVKYDTWKRSKPAYETGVGLNADAYQNVGAANAKWAWQATIYATYNTLAQLEVYATTQTASLRTLKFQDVYGTVFDVLWMGPFLPAPASGDLNGANELYEVEMKLVQR